MTNDAERVSDVVIRLRENSRIWEPEAIDKFCIEAADIIEAQSKALAEAREWAAARKEFLAQSSADVRVSDVAKAALNRLADAEDALFHTLIPTPENPNG